MLAAIDARGWFQHTAARRRLADAHKGGRYVFVSFNTQPPEGGWGLPPSQLSRFFHVSTHSRPKAAGVAVILDGVPKAFQHTAARRRLVVNRVAACRVIHSFNTQPPEGGWRLRLQLFCKHVVSTHSRPKAAGAPLKSLAPSSFAAPISLSSQEKREREYNTAFSVTPAFAIS